MTKLQLEIQILKNTHHLEDFIPQKMNEGQANKAVSISEPNVLYPSKGEKKALEAWPWTKKLRKISYPITRMLVLIFFLVSFVVFCIGFMLSMVAIGKSAIDLDLYYWIFSLIFMGLGGVFCLACYRQDKLLISWRSESKSADKLNNSD